MLEKSLATVKGVNSLTAKLDTNRIIIETSLSSGLIQNEIESCTKSLAVLRGMGSNLNERLDSAVAEISDYENNNVSGVIRFVQIDTDHCALDGTIGNFIYNEFFFPFCFNNL